ncbi:MAG: C4-type zinc ribbon domain-containing protein [Candidatus Cloacimonadaceae bacterium]|nr:C4-type zinc ribbon domain-containing protein [Candidatus Cloacimonadaceae bacterium]MDP3113168.1 C4-type zinc ribbon domain-containing protein [Candidatus Cloacimonadaceae bacterium]
MVETQLRTLCKMQALDDKIGRYKVLQQELPKQLNDIIESVDQATINLLNTETQRAELAKKQRSIEGDVKQYTDQIKKYSTQLSEIKTNKEYKALNSEIIYLKDKISDLESQEIELLDQESVIKEQSSLDKAVLEAAEKHKREKEGDLRAQIEKLESEIESTRAMRNELARTLPTNLIKQYGNMIKNKGNQAVVYSINGACGGCGFVIRPQIRIELELRKKINTCESCGRILIMKFEDPEPET